MSLKQSDSQLEVGEKAPEFDLEDHKEQDISLSDLDNYDGVAAVFMCNHCPYVQMHIQEIQRLIREYSSIAFVGINPNADTHPLDSVDKMGEFVKENDLDSENFYYLVDSSQEVAEEFGAVCTPDPFLLDMRHKLFYHGRISDKSKPDEEAAERTLKKAIDDMLKSKEPPENQPPSQGCSIKWKK